MSVLVDEVTHAGKIRAVAFEGAGEEQRLRGRRGMVQAVPGAVLTALALVFEQRLDVRRVFNLLAAVEGAGVGGNPMSSNMPGSGTCALSMMKRKSEGVA